MTNANDPMVSNWLKGRDPEFSTKSNRPGIGAGALHEVADILMKFNLDTSLGDVPVTLRHGSRKLPLGRYMRKRLRELVGMEVTDSSASRQEVFERLQHLLQMAKEDNENPSFKAQVVKSGEQKFRNLEAKLGIHKREKKL